MTQIKGRRQEIGVAGFLRFHITEVLILFDDVPKGHHKGSYH